MFAPQGMTDIDRVKLDYIYLKNLLNFVLTISVFLAVYTIFKGLAILWGIWVLIIILPLLLNKFKTKFNNFLLDIQATPQCLAFISTMKY